MFSGIARSVTGLPTGERLMMKLHARPLSFTICGPKNSAMRRAVVSAKDFWLSGYSDRRRLMLLDSVSFSITSSSLYPSP